MSTLELSQMQNLRVAPCSEKGLPQATNSRRAVSKYMPHAPHRAACAVVTLRAEEAQPQTTESAKRPSSVKPGKVGQHVPKKVQAAWMKMMTEMKEAGSPVFILKAQQKSGKISKGTFVATLMKLKMLKEWKFIIKILEWLKDQNWWTFSELDYNLLLAAYGKVGEPEKILKTINSMKEAGFQPNVASNTALIEAYGKKGLLNEAESILNKMLKEGPKPTALTYQAVIGAYVKGGKHEDAERIFKNVESDNIVKPDQRMFNLMIHSYGKRGMLDEAFHLSRKMKALSIPLSVVTFNSLMACQPSVKDAESVLRQMQRMQIEPDVFSYASRISAYAKARRGEEAQYFFKVMVDSGIRPNHTVYNVLLDAYANCKMVEEAESLLKEMRRERFSPDVHSYTTLMNAYVNVPNMEKAEKVIERMKLAKVEPNIVTYGTLIKGYAEAGDLQKMVNKYEEMVGLELKLNQMVFTIMLQAFGRYDSLDRAKSWFQEMLAAGLEPDERACNTLLTLSTPLDRRDEILDFLDKLK